MLTLFTIPGDYATSSMAYIGDIFSDAGLLIALAIGIPLAFYVITRVMKLLPKG